MEINKPSRYSTVAVGALWNFVKHWFFIRSQNDQKVLNFFQMQIIRNILWKKIKQTDIFFNRRTENWNIKDKILI